MPSEAKQKKIMEKLNRAQKCSILGPQNLGSRGARAPGAPPESAPGTNTVLLRLSLHIINIEIRLKCNVRILIFEMFTSRQSMNINVLAADVRKSPTIKLCL